MTVPQCWPLEVLHQPSPTLAEPPDFDKLWRATWDELMHLPLDWRVEGGYEDARHGGRVEEVSFRSATEQAVGWITRPAGRPVVRGGVVSHGYGGRPDGPDPPPVPAADAAWTYPCVPGLPRSNSPAIPAGSSEHVLHGIRSRDTYVHRFWLGASR